MRISPAARLVVFWFGLFATALLPAAPGSDRPALIPLGAARVDVTPTEPIRLTGYASRKTSHQGVEQKLWAKALAIGDDRSAARPGGPVVLITLDNCGVSEGTWREVRQRLERLAGLGPGCVVIASSHTHSAPATKDWAPNIFVQDLTAEEQGAIDRYTANLIAQLEQVALTALRARQPGRLSWTQGRAGFAGNRRTQGGPVDPALPVLKAEKTDGELIALVANYACHCTTIGGEFNRACGDWAGYAQEAIEQVAPGAVALVTIGCGADANPSPRGGADFGLALARLHGDEIGSEMKRLLGLTFSPLKTAPLAKTQEIELPFGPHFTREQWLARSTNNGIVGYHAKKWLARLERGEALPNGLYYPITSWSFGDDLSMVFLPGEVVVDYALRLKRELDRSRLWVTAYANYVPCYIPSRRILAEGGYEAEDSLWYYDRPARISTNAEDRIVSTVRDLVPATFRAHPERAERPDPLGPRQALGRFQLAKELAIDLVAAEPMVQSPVAIDWDARGRLWVCEMNDYPSGMNPPPDVDRKYGEPVREPPGGFTPGGRIRILTDADGDGRFERSTIFLDRIPFPTGVFPWGDGALICAAPNILHAVDTDGDGHADVVRTNVTGFATHNFQARVNGFTWGLDGWLHGSSGLFGGKVKVLAPDGKVIREVDLSGRDFRYRPDTGELEPVSGISQMGRVRDEFDQWFGNDNSTLLWHYPLPDHYLRRNPHVAYPEPKVSVARGADINRLFPASQTLTRFNDPQMANIVTSACGPDIYRDDLLGEEYHGNAFICEPVHNLVRRLVLEPDGVTFAGHRAPGEERGEFLASSDNWFRPVQVRTGPDGALYVVDMYRFVVEHPRWIPPERLKELDVRAGADRGRIYRVTRRGVPLRPTQDVKQADEQTLFAALDTANGPTRDLVHREMMARGWPKQDRFDGDIVITEERPANPPAGKFKQMFAMQRLLRAKSPGVRAQALSIAADKSGMVRWGLADSDPRIYRLALRYCEPYLASGKGPRDRSWSMTDLTPLVLRMATKHDPAVRFQTALTLGEWQTVQGKRALIDLMPGADRWLQAAILSSAAPRATELLESVVPWPPGAISKSDWVGRLTATALGAGGSSNLAGVLAAITAPSESAPASGEVTLEPWRIEAVRSLIEALRKQQKSLTSIRSELGANGAASLARMERLLEMAGELATSAGTDRVHREAVFGLLGAADTEAGMKALKAVLAANELVDSHPAAVAALARSQRSEPGERWISGWNTLAPSLRTSVVDALLTRPAWTERLLDALERDQVRVSEIGPSQRQRLLNQRDESARQRATKVFASSSGQDRTSVREKFSGVAALTGSSERGAAVFDRVCAQCHAVRGRGHDVGPNLGEFAGKEVADFLMAILDPNAAINPNFVAYTVETGDGRSLSGIVRHETASSLTLVQGGGVRETILRSDLKQVRANAVSLMPEGLEQGMTLQDLADLIAWLKRTKPAVFGQASTVSMAQARREWDQLGPATGLEVIRTVERLPYPSWLGRWPLAYCRQNAGQERLVWKARPGVGAKTSSGRLTYLFPAAMGHKGEPAGGFTLKVNGGSPVPFDVTLADQDWVSSDGRVRMSYQVREANSQDSCGSLVVEIPETSAGVGPVEFEVTGSIRASQRWFGIYLVGSQ